AARSLGSGGREARRLLMKSVSFLSPSACRAANAEPAAGESAGRRTTRCQALSVSVCQVVSPTPSSKQAAAASSNRRSQRDLLRRASSRSTDLSTCRRSPAGAGGGVTLANNSGSSSFMAFSRQPLTQPCERRAVATGNRAGGQVRHFGDLAERQSAVGF